MRKYIGWAGLRTAGVALAVCGLFASTAAADPLIRFSTVGSLSVDETTVTGENVIGFNNIISQAFTAPSNISLGEFQVIPGLGDEVTTTYNNTPFTLTVGVEEINGGVPDPNETPVVISGWLNGTITGASQSNVQATFDLDSSDPLSFRVGDFVASLTQLDPVNIAPFTTNGGRTSIQGRLETVPATQIPEPASIAVFLAALVGGIGLRRRALARPTA